MIHTVTTEAGETIRTMTPIEYVKSHDAADRVVKRHAELTGFATFLATQLGLQASLPPSQIEALITTWIATTPA